MSFYKYVLLVNKTLNKTLFYFLHVDLCVRIYIIKLQINLKFIIIIGINYYFFKTISI
jgi:hypothetical protein